MRVLVGRNDWCPAIRVEGLLRYAFLGDSFAYGAGVAPDETLPANFERRANELAPGWPVECLNFGVSGYNLWNSWLAFKQAPQVFDGMVLALCHNDAEFGGRTFRASHPKPSDSRWQPSHATGAAVARCFDDMAAFSREHSMPVAVVFYNMSNFSPISQVLADLCAARALIYIDTHHHYRERNLARADLVVSSTDSHPSAIAHDAVGRHLAATVSRAGWLDSYRNSDIEMAPDRIAAAVRAMVAADRYPPDAALNWGLRTLDAKRLVGRRLEAAESEGGRHEGFSAAAARCAAELGASSLRWHVGHRLRAFSASLATENKDLSRAIFCAQEERSKLEELCFALQSEDFERLAAASLDNSPLKDLASGAEFPTGGEILETYGPGAPLPAGTLESVRDLAAPAAVGSARDECSIRADLASIERLAERAQEEWAALKALLSRVDDAFKAARPSLPLKRQTQVLGIVDASMQRVKGGFAIVRRLPGLMQGLRDEKNACFTTVEVTICSGLAEGGSPSDGPPSCSLGVQAEYQVPFRLRFIDSGPFQPTGSPTLLRFRFPVFYAGRLFFTARRTIPPAGPITDFEVIKLDIYNSLPSRKTVDPATLWRDPNGRLVSPLIYLV